MFRSSRLICGLLLFSNAGTLVFAQAPGGEKDQPPPASGNSKAATEVLAKAFALYRDAKTYQGDWVYLQQQDGADVHKMVIELRSKGPGKLLFHLRAPRENADKPNSVSTVKNPVLPEVRVVLDGKFAWSENATEKVYYKVPLPKNMLGSPLMFFPQLATVGGAERGQDEKVGDRTVAVIFAKTKTGGLSRMEIDTSNNRIVRIASDEVAGFTRTISTLVLEKEVFDGEIPDSTFTYRPPKGFKEMPAPSEAIALFGVDPAEKPSKDK